MGRNKIKIEKIENTRIRQVTFYKRKKGLIKKSMELSLLCEAKILLCVLDKNEKLTTYISDSETLKDFEEYFFNKNILKENFNNKDYKELFQGSGKNNNSNDSKSDDFDLDNFKKDDLRDNKFGDFNETLNIASGCGAYDEKSKVRDDSVNEGILNFFNMIKSKNPSSVDYACKNNFEKPNDLSNAQFQNQKFNMENSVSKELKVPNVTLNNEEGSTPNLNNLLLNYLNTNPSLVNESSINSDANPIYSHLINLINSGIIGAENISLLMNNLNEIIKSNMTKNNNVSNLISFNPENSEYKDVQSNLIEIAKRINESKRNINFVNLPIQNNYNHLIQNILSNQPTQNNYLINTNLGALNNHNIVDNLNILRQNFQNSNGVSTGNHNASDNHIFDKNKRELNSNYVTNKIKSPQLSFKSNNQSLNKIINFTDDNSNQESNQITLNNGNIMEEFKDNSGNDNQQDLMNKKRKRDDLHLKTEGIESFKEMFFKEKISKSNQNCSSNNSNVSNNPYLCYDISNTNNYNKSLPAPFREVKNTSLTSKNNDTNKSITDGYSIENQFYSLNKNTQNLTPLTAQNQILNKVAMNNFDYLSNLNNNLTQNLLNFSTSMNQINLNYIQKPNELKTSKDKVINKNKDDNNQIFFNKVNQNNLNYNNHAENRSFNYNSNFYNNNELNKIDIVKVDNSNNLNAFQKADLKQSSNNLESFSSILTENNQISPKKSEKDLASVVQSFQNFAIPGNFINANNFIKNESISTSTRNLNEETNNSVNNPIQTETQFAENLNSFVYAKPEQLLLFNLIQGNIPMGKVNLENINSILGQFSNNKPNNNETFNSLILNNNNSYMGINNLNNNIGKDNHCQINNNDVKKNNFENNNSKAEYEKSKQ